jgi:hypothetical protein
VRQRFTPQLAEFVEALFRRAIGTVVEAEKTLAPLLGRFTKVVIHDSTTIKLPDALAERFPGCGGSHGSGKAAMKLQVQWELKKGGWECVSIESGRDCDYKTPLQSTPLPANSLVIKDLGYFDTEVLARYCRESIFWLSRLQFGTAVFSPDGKLLQLLKWLSEQRDGVIDQPVLIGTEHKVPCRLMAWRVPQEVANRRRQKLIAEARRKNGRTPTDERLAWCDWIILVTNVPAELMTPQEAIVLYRARWQIELMFKRWKSLGLVAQLNGATLERQMAQLWLRLLAVIIEHWLVLTAAWGDIRVSLHKASQLIRSYALLFADALTQNHELKHVIETLRRAIRSTAQQNKRRRPSTFELLNDPSLLEYVLT